MDLEKITAYLISALLGILGFFLKRELDKNTKDMEEVKKDVVLLGKKIELNEQRDKSTRELIEQKLDNHRAIMEERFKNLTDLIERSL